MTGRADQIGIEMEPPVHLTTPGSRQTFSQRMHHARSASWSFTRVQREAGGDLPSPLAALNPLTSVIRAFRESTSEVNSPDTPGSLSRTASQVSLAGGRSYGDELLDELPPAGPALQDIMMPRGIGQIQNHGPVVNGEELNNNNIGMEISDGIRWLERNAIFIILLLIKFAWYHRSGLMVILGMFGTYLQCNQAIKKQVALKNRKQKKVLLFVILFLAGNIYFVYYVFRQQQLHNCLIFLSPHFSVDLWNLLWCICVTDYIIRFGTMALKAVVALCCCLPSRRKGKYYVLLEYISQSYRSLVPLPLWFRYLSNSHHSGAIFAITITTIYLMIKGSVLFGNAKTLCWGVVDFIKDPIYGMSPTQADLLCHNNTCSICQEDFNSPIMLKCRHIFCENCVLQWFDRQSTCPLCRATIVSDPKWRDGSTSTWPQLF